jgi:hypothetical protein
MARCANAAVPAAATQQTATRAHELCELGALATPHDMIAAVTRLAIAGALRVPLPGSGDTATRFRALSEIAAVDLSLARIGRGPVRPAGRARVTEQRASLSPPSAVARGTRRAR